jgi:hypothetical protein
MDINMQSPMPEPDHDDEGKMAKADLYKSAKYSLKLFKMMEDDAQLEGWVQAKITKAADYLASVYHYLEYEMKFTEYGRAIEDSEMYTESEKKLLKNKLLEAKEKVKDLKKAQAEKLKAKEKKKVDEDQAGIDDIHADIRGRGDKPKRRIAPGVDSPFDEFEPKKGHKRITRRSDSPASGNDAKGDVPMTSLHPDHDERAAKFLAKQVRGNKVSPMDQLTKRKGMSDLDEAKAKKAKKDYDGDGKVETGKDEVIGSRRKAAGLPFKEGAKPDFLDMDKDGNKKEPMKKAAANKKVKEDGATAPPPKDKTGQYPMITSGPNKGKRWTPEAPGPTTPGFKEATEKKCNHTAKGKSCPVHGMKECSGMMEAKPSAGMSKGEKSAVAKKAQAGKDIGKPGKSFDKVAKAAGGGAKGTKIAAAAMWKNQAK